jgi:dihydroorotase (multifunctional complex type)
MLNLALTVETVLYNASIFTSGRIIRGGIAIEDGKIFKIAKEVNLPIATNKIDLDGCLAIPGLVDVHVHLRGQMQAYKEDFFTGTSAAVAGGITTLLDMPNNEPVTMDSGSLKQRIKDARSNILANVGFFSAIPESLNEIHSVVQCGAIAFKLYLNSQIGGIDIDDDDKLLEAFKEIRELGIPIAVHAEDREMINKASKTQQSLGFGGINAYLEAHTPYVEIKAVKRILRLAHRSKAHVHFCHVSSDKTIFLIQEARSEGVAVSCEGTPHHLLLSSEDLRNLGQISLTDPPVRTRKVMRKLWEALRDAQIDIIASDHAPHGIREKKGDSIWNVKPGIPGLETLLPLFLTKVNERKITLTNLLRLTAQTPCEIFGLQGRGSLKEGNFADITIIDLHRQSRIDSSRFHSKAKYSPFDQWSVKGVPIKTFVNGLLVMDEGKIVENAGAGNILQGNASVK